MFEYNYNHNQNILNVTLPKRLKYGFEFMSEIAEMVDNILKRKYYQVRISCQNKPEYDRMCKAYIYNVLRSLLPKTKILWSVELNNVIASTISPKSGNKFSEIDIKKDFLAEELSDYRFHNDQSVNRAVEAIAKVIVEENVTIEENTVEEFLITTIGEIFSNAFSHSERDEVFFLYDIQKENDDFYLCVTVIDYGNTIVHNVREFFWEEKREIIESKACMAWAIVERNTTRRGSGGYGLSTLINCVREVDGELVILSGDVFYKLREQQEEIVNIKGVFLGTSVMFRIKLFETNKIIRYDEINEKLTSISLENL